MRGSKRLPIEELAVGSYRPSRHGIKLEQADSEKLDIMKDTLYTLFFNYKANLSKLEIQKNLNC